MTNIWNFSARSCVNTLIVVCTCAAHTRANKNRAPHCCVRDFGCRPCRLVPKVGLEAGVAGGFCRHQPAPPAGAACRETLRFVCAPLRLLRWVPALIPGKKKKPSPKGLNFFLVPKVGLEPTHVHHITDFESAASAIPPLRRVQPI